jgi:hypothetical protein
MTKKIVPLISLGLFVLVLACKRWDVSPGSYFVFTFGFTVLLLASLKKPVNEFLLLTNIFFTLGFWLKATFHILTGQDFIEPAGDHALEVLEQSLYFAGFAAVFLAGVPMAVRKFKIAPMVPPEKVYRQNVLVIAVMFFSILVCYYNWEVGFFRVGLPSRNDLYFPMNTFLYWYLGPGGAFLTFLVASKAYSALGSLPALITMPFVGITTLSRNSLMYFCYPVFLKFFRNLKDYKRGVFYSTLAVAVMVVAIIQTSNLRTEFFSTKITAEISEGLTAKANSQPAPTFTAEPKVAFKPKMELANTKTQMSEMLIDRWVGIEGLLVARQNVSDSIFLDLVKENPKKNPDSLYRELSRSQYPKRGALLFSTFPGPLGMIFTAQSFYLIFLGLVAYSALLILTYYLIEKYTSGLSKSSLIWWAAMNVVQISIFPAHNLKIYFLFLGACLAISVIFHKLNNSLINLSASKKD